MRRRRPCNTAGLGDPLPQQGHKQSAEHRPPCLERQVPGGFHTMARPPSRRGLLSTICIGGVLRGLAMFRLNTELPRGMRARHTVSRSVLRPGQAAALYSVERGRPTRGVEAVPDILRRLARGPREPTPAQMAWPGTSCSIKFGYRIANGHQKNSEHLEGEQTRKSGAEEHRTSHSDQRIVANAGGTDAHPIPPLEAPFRAVMFVLNTSCFVVYYSPRTTDLNTWQHDPPKSPNSRDLELRKLRPTAATPCMHASCADLAEGYVFGRQD